MNRVLPWAAGVVLLVVGMPACAGGSKPAASTARVSVHDCRFDISGEIGLLGASLPVTGSGLLAFEPEAAADLQVSTTNAFETTDAAVIDLDGSIYSRMGNHAWDETRAAGAEDWAVFGDPVPMLAVLAKYGSSGPDEIVDGAAARHLSATDSTGTYDEWLRKSDGVVLRLQYSVEGATAPIVLTCRRWDTHATVRAPDATQLACADRTPGDVSHLQFLSARSVGNWATYMGFDAGVQFRCHGVILAIYRASQSTAGDAISALSYDAAAQHRGSTASWGFSSYQGRYFDVVTTSTLTFTDGFGCMNDPPGCDSGVKLRVGAVKAGSSVYVVFFVADPNVFDADYAAAKAILDSVTFDS